MMRPLRLGMVLTLACGLLLAPKASQAAELPADDKAAVARLDASPRHGEYVEIDVPGREGGPLRTWVVYPERTTNAPVVIVIHEIFGLTDWVRGVADQLAAEGFIAIAPDMISGRVEGGGGSESLRAPAAGIGYVTRLAREEVDTGLNAVFDYAKTIPAATGKVSCVGYCWGGRQSFAFAAAQPGLSAAVVYYGNGPGAESVGAIEAPVLGLYGEADQRVTVTVEPTKGEMEAAGKAYEIEIYDGAGHGFLRAQSLQDGKNQAAAEHAWARTLAFFRQHGGE